MSKTISENEKLALIQINAGGYMRADWCNRLIKVFGSACDVIKSSASDISQNGAVSIDTAENFLKEISSIDPHNELEKVHKTGGIILTQNDDDYPQMLKEIAQPPVVLYVRGSLETKFANVAIVGTRKPSKYGIRTASMLASDLSKCSITVVSGLARGIDSVAHKAVVDLGGITWAVIGTGLGKCYPAENRKLAESIIDKGGAIVTEFPFDKGPMAFHFPRRNRIIAGLSCLSVVVEGAKRSGALITARLALEQGRDVLAVPGQIDEQTSQGPNLLIRDGAGIVTNALDIVTHIPLQYKSLVKEDALSGCSLAKENCKLENLSQDESAVLKFVGKDSFSLDDIACKLNWSIPKVSSILFQLETKLILVNIAGKYERKL